MSTAEIEVVEAFTSIGIAPDKAMAAAAALNSHGNSVSSDLSALKSDVATLKMDVAALKTDVAALKTDVGGLKSDMTLLKWMIGFALAILVGLLFKALHG